MVIEVVDTEVVSANNIEIEIPNEAIIVSEDNKDYDVRIVKKEYTIIGDGIFIPSMHEDAPPWLKEFIDTTIEIAIINRDQSLVDRMQAILTLMDYVPKNQYTEQINQIISEDGIINSRIATLNSNLVDAINNINATIAKINLTYVSKSEASAIVYNALTASLSSSGEIGSSLIAMEEAYVNLKEAVASQVNYMEATFEEFTEGTTQQINSIKAYAEGIESKFAYNSKLQIDGASYESGFGLATSLTENGGIPVGNSEFWIKADKFRLVSSSGIKSSYSPFSVDATTRDINFNGKVLFENVVGAQNGNKTYLQNDAPTTEMEVGDIWVDSNDNYKQYRYDGSSWVAFDFDPASLINLKTTTIDGGKITTNSIAASKISSYNLTSSNATIGNALIDTAHIKDLSVDTIKIKDNAVSAVVSSIGGGKVISNDIHTSPETAREINSVSFQYDGLGSITILIFFYGLSGSDNGASEVMFTVKRNGTQIFFPYGTDGFRFFLNYSASTSLSIVDTPPSPGLYTYTLNMYATARWSVIGRSGLTCIGLKK